MKLCIGTVQFGMDYGVQGAARPPVEDAVAMLDYAIQNGVDAIDTAVSYGEAEKVVGEFLGRKTVPRESLQVISKFGMDVFAGAGAAEWPKRLRAAAEASLARLRTEYLDAFICHVPTAAGNAAVTDAMVALRETGLARHIGFSVYGTDEARASLAAKAVDFMQVPFSVLDQRMAREGVFAAAEERGVDVHARSAFVQGLMLMPVESIPERVAAARPYVAGLDVLCRERGISRRALALAFVKAQRGISHLLFGVDGMGQLKEIVADFALDVPREAVEAIAARMAEVPSEIFMPNRWRKA